MRFQIYHLSCVCLVLLNFQKFAIYFATLNNSIMVISGKIIKKMSIREILFIFLNTIPKDQMSAFSV